MAKSDKKATANSRLTRGEQTKDPKFYREVDSEPSGQVIRETMLQKGMTREEAIRHLKNPPAKK